MRVLATMILLATTVLLAQDAAPKKGGGMPHKNLKVLPDENIGQIMQAYRVALGAQNCQYCHVQGDFASDENQKKEVARNMIRMTNEINAKFPGERVRVTCYTCHAGKEHPATAPAPAQ
jgi:hypothetical protein